MPLFKLRPFFLSIHNISSLKETSPFDYKVLKMLLTLKQKKRCLFISNHRATLIWNVMQYFMQNISMIVALSKIVLNSKILCVI